MMSSLWTLFHAGALGDLLLTLDWCRSVLPNVSGPLAVVARVNLGRVLASRFDLRLHSSDSCGLHWLFGGDGPAPPALEALVRGRGVLSCLGEAFAAPNVRLRGLGPETLCCLDPRAEVGCAEPIRDQWTRRMSVAVGRLPPAPGSAPCSAFAGLASADAPESRVAAELHVALHPGSGGRAKCWPLASYLELANQLQAGGGRVRFLLGPVERETWPADALEALHRRAALVVCDDADTLAREVCAAHSYVGNDSGPTHLAALLGRPTVALFGPTQVAVWAPRGPRVRALQGDPTHADGTWGITPEHVRGALTAVRA